MLYVDMRRGMNTSSLPYAIVQRNKKTFLLWP